jgi:hypothetical protein
LLQQLFALCNDIYKLTSSFADNIGFKEVVRWLCGVFNGKIRFLADLKILLMQEKERAR